MQYIITFLEGFISFISPCMLPMLPVYISYFAGRDNQKHKTIFKALAFVTGFTVTFTLLGLFAGTLGSVLAEYRTILNIVTGIIVIIFGLSYLEVINISFFKGMNSAKKIDTIFSAFLFGFVYSVSLTPCVGTFLGAALMMASSAGDAAQGTLLLLIYSLGLGIPFVFSAILIDKLKMTVAFIKGHYKIINLVSGVFLIIVGVMMILGMMNNIFSLFS